jgi:hypothetical protein
VIRVRYKDLSSGLNGKAEQCSGGVTVYLVPGLTGSQRKAALRRLRQEASRGCGPALPTSQLKVALGWDRARRAFGGVVAVVRLHPAASLLNATAVGALMTLFVLASVSIAPASQAVPGGTTAGGGSSAPVAFISPHQAALWSLAVTSRPGADGKGFAVRARSGFRLGASQGLGWPIRISINVPSSP